MIRGMVIGVYGLGRFGGFWARQLAARFDVCGWSRSESRPTPEGVRRVDEDEVLRSDVIVLCVAISSMEHVLTRISGKLKPSALVMDTCSVKVYPSELMLSILPPETAVMATHPMFGPDSGRKGIAGLPVVLCPLRVSGEQTELWHGYFRNMGLNVVRMSPDQHDKEAAYSQGITHFVGRVLGELNLNPSVIGTAGYAGLLNLVRQTCNDPWQLFNDLQQFNPYTAGMRKDLHHAISTMLGKFDEAVSGTAPEE